MSDTDRKKKQSWNKVALHPPLSAGPAGTAGAVQEKYLPNVSAGGLHHTTFARWHESVYKWSQNVCRHDVSLLVGFYLTISGRLAGGVLRKEALVLLLLQLPPLRARGPSRCHKDRLL